LTNAYPVHEDQFQQGPTGVIKSEFYAGLNTDQVDDLHFSEIIQAATICRGGGNNGRFQFQESLQSSKRSIFNAVKCYYFNSKLL
jgi:hypothetical protein